MNLRKLDWQIQVIIAGITVFAFPFGFMFTFLFGPLILAGWQILSALVNLIIINKNRALKKRIRNYLIYVFSFSILFIAMMYQNRFEYVHKDFTLFLFLMFNISAWYIAVYYWKTCRLLWKDNEFEKDFQNLVRKQYL